VSGLAGEVEVRPAVTVSCEAAEMMARWTYEVVVPAARETLGGAVTLLSTADSYSCRNRNQAVSGRMSEHALGHAVDIAAVTVGGRSLAIAAPKGAASEETAFRVAIRRGACSYFTTVLGPGSDAAHANHMHLDVITRPSGYRLCQ
jgi:hypothetical protein